MELKTLNTVVPEKKPRRRAAGAIAAAALGALIFAGPSFGQDKPKTESPSLGISKAFKLSGWTQVQYVDWKTGVDSFSVRRSRLTLTGDIIKNMHYKLQMEVAKSFALLDASIDYEFSKAVQLRVGQFMVPFSLENLTGTSDVDMVNRSQPEEKLAPGRDNSAQGRDIGVSAFGTYSIIDYTVAVLNGAGINKADTNDHKDVAGRVVVHPFKELSVGGSFYKGKQSATSTDPLVTRDKAGLEIALVYPRMSLKAEYFYAKDDVITRNGWYVQGGYFIMPKKLQFLLKADAVDMNRDLVDDRINRYTAGVNWFLSGRTKLQVNYEQYKGEIAKNDNHAFLAQLQVAF
jgi:phosphate-selective porin OprO and OprP